MREKVERCLGLKGRALSKFLSTVSHTHSGKAVAQDFAQWREFLTNDVNKEMFCENLAVKTHHTQMRYQYENLHEGYNNLSKVVVPALLHLVNRHGIANGEPLFDRVENDTLVFLAILLEKERDTGKFHRRMFELTSAKLDQQEETIYRLEQELAVAKETVPLPNQPFISATEQCIRCYIIQMRNDVDCLTKFATGTLL